MQLSYKDNEIDKVYRTLIDAGITLRWDGAKLQAGPRQLATRYAELIRKYKPGLIAMLNGQRVNDFEESLEKGANNLHFAFLEEVYRRAFYNFDSMIRTKNGNTRAQKNGSDVVIYTTSDKLYRIDEKIRDRTDYSDIALEYMSSDRSKTDGWMEKDLGIDYLNYVFAPIKRSYLFPWQQLKLVWNKNKKTWLADAQNRERGFSVVSSPNPTYHTLSCAVPTELLIQEVRDAIVIQLT